MSTVDTEREERLSRVLEEIGTELRQRGRIDMRAWISRHQDLGNDLTALARTLRDLEMAVGDCRAGVALEPTGVPTGEFTKPDIATHDPAPRTAVDPQRLPGKGNSMIPARFGRYIVTGELGEGGMGKVYRATDPDLRRQVAVKVPTFVGPAVIRSSARDRFLREARAAAAVRHPHVCPIHDVGEQDGIPYVVMALVEGGSLHTGIDLLPHAVELVRQAAEGLAAVHAAGIVHRDIKPGNILLGADGQALLTDFGLARYEADGDRLTADGGLIGTPAYMAPEQAALGAGPVGPHTDIYSLGAVLYDLVAGRPPFVGTALEVIYQVGQAALPPPSRFRPGLDRNLEAIILKAMSRRPEDRYRSASAFAEELRRWLEESHTTDTPGSLERTIAYETANATIRSDSSDPSAEVAEMPARLGPYEITGKLGEGGMGVVYLARDSRLERQVALKVMRPEITSQSMRKRFLREARACAAIAENPHLVTIYQVGEEQGIPFLAMQYLKGSSLNDRLKEGARFGAREVLRIGREVATGLAAAHERGLIHRDIKPGNIWIETPSGKVKVLDFGLARPIEEEDQDNLTQSGQILGTPGYMSPEQADGEPVDGRTDLFSLGCVLYQLAAGRPAFTGKGSLGVLKALVTQNPPPPHQLDPSVPRSLSNLIVRLISKDPSERPASAGLLVDEITAIETELGFNPLATATLPSATPHEFDFLETPQGGEQTDTAEKEKNRKKIAMWKLYTALGAILAVAGLALLVAMRNGKDRSPPPEDPEPSSLARSEKTGKEPPKKNSTPIVPPDFQKLPPAQQKEIIARALERLNRGFVAKQKYSLVIEEYGSGSIKAVSIAADGLSDLQPLRHLPDLVHVSISAGGKAVDLKAFAGSPLTYLELKNAIVDLDDLVETKSLTHLHLIGSTIANLDKVKDYPLKPLSLSRCAGPLRLDVVQSIPTLRSLDISGLPVADLNELKDLKLESLDFSDCKNVKDIEVLLTVPLKSVRCTFIPSYAKVLKSIKTLETINGEDKDQFFKD
jgi:serine/threonine protein kinase